RALRSFRQPSNVGPARLLRRRNPENRAKCGEMAKKLSQVSALRYYLLFLVEKRDVFHLPR
ncbi:hypothetical protein, partial [Palleronia pontilimi]|uniref:hypothetical protein n=1 Tax=Palleronia pontilimi TaxID=1964209 RepID=UPI001BE420E6